VAVFGNAGGGKSTLARRLAEPTPGLARMREGEYSRRGEVPPF